MNYFDELLYGVKDIKEIKMNKRDFLKVMFTTASIAIVSKPVVELAVSVGRNVHSLKSKDQFDLKHLQLEYDTLNCGSPKIIKKAIAEKTINVEVYDLAFSSKNPRKNPEIIEKYLQEMINTLDDIQVNINYRYIMPYTPEVYLNGGTYSEIEEQIIADELEKDPDFVKKMNEKQAYQIKSNADELKDIIHTGTLVSDEINYEDKIYSILVNYMGDYNEVDKFQDRNNVSIIIGDIDGGWAGGISYLGNQIIITSRSYSTNEQYAKVMAHEIGHKLNLAHTILPDVMSYAPDKSSVFGIESRLQWKKTKELFN